MGTETLQTLLGRQPFVHGFQPHQIDSLAKLATEVRFEADHVLFREDDECSEFYLILSGLVALEIAPAGQAFRVDTLSSGDELGWSSVLGRGRLFQARALTPVEALSFDAAALRAMCEADTAFGYALMQRLLVVVADRLQATRLQVLDSFWPVAKRAGA
jgi:CRP/FNR family cyclic AMP-dependent transcriptional regulator